MSILIQNGAEAEDILVPPHGDVNDAVAHLQGLIDDLELADNAIGLSLTNLQDQINNLPPPGGIDEIFFARTEFQTNLNNAAPNTVVLKTAEVNTIVGASTTTPGEILLPEGQFYFSGRIFTVSSAQRSNVFLTTNIGLAVGANGYIRSSSGAAESTPEIEDLITITNPNNTFILRGNRTANTGTVFSIADNGYVFLKRVKS